MGVSVSVSVSVISLTLSTASVPRLTSALPPPSVFVRGCFLWVFLFRMHILEGKWKQNKIPLLLIHCSLLDYGHRGGILNRKCRLCAGEERKETKLVHHHFTSLPSYIDGGDS